MEYRRNIISICCYKWRFMATILSIAILCVFLLYICPYAWKILFGKNKQPCGEIFDCNGKPLVINQRCCEIYADPKKLKDAGEQKRIAELAAEYFGSDPKRVLARMKKKYVQPNPGMDPIPCRYALIARYASLEQTTMFMEKLKNLNLEKRVYVRENTKRYYPNGNLLSNVLGVVTLDDDKRGQFGVEAWIYNEEQRKNRLGQVLLTINLDIQKMLENELTELEKKCVPGYLCAILVNPRNGNILAIAQRPDFNPNERDSLSMHQPGITRNFIFGNSFKPGPMIIPLVVAGALILIRFQI